MPCVLIVEDDEDIRDFMDSKRFQYRPRALNSVMGTTASRPHTLR